MNCNFYYLYYLLSTFQLIKTCLQQTLECMQSSHIIIKMKDLLIYLALKTFVLLSEEKNSMFVK
jgi:hypothetical protein